MTVEMSGSMTERQERLCHTVSAEAVYPLGCRLEELGRFAEKATMPLLEIPRWQRGNKASPMLVLCPELSGCKNGQNDLLREVFYQLSGSGIWPQQEQSAKTYLLVGKREVFLAGGATYCGQDAMKPPEARNILNGWQLAYYLPPINGQLLRVGTETAKGFLRDGPPFLADSNWQAFLSEIDESLGSLAVNLAWTDAVRGNDYY